MPPELVFLSHLVLGYIAWLLCLRTYIWPKLRAMDPFDAHRAIATLHSFRFFGLAFVMPGVVGAHLPGSFAGAAAYGDFATGILALLALLTARIPRLFWLFIVAFNLAGAGDLLLDYGHAIRAGLPAHAGELGGMYAVVILYVPLLMLTHVAAFSLLLRARPWTARADGSLHRS